MVRFEDYRMKESITFRLRGAASAAPLSKRLLGIIIIHHIGPHSHDSAGFPLG
jgi:hypothetical protein